MTKAELTAGEMVVKFEPDRIVRNPAILAGKPTIRGTRISVEFILEVMAAGWTITDILENYPGITREDIGACLSYACEAVSLKQATPRSLTCNFLPTRIFRALQSTR